MSVLCGAYRFTDIVSPIEREIRALSHGLTSVKDEQEYIVIRERTHRNTAESTNDRVKWWSILQFIVLASVVAWQVYYLKVCALLCLYTPPLLTSYISHSSRSSGRSSLGMWSPLGLIYHFLNCRIRVIDRTVVDISENLAVASIS